MSQLIDRLTWQPGDLAFGPDEPATEETVTPDVTKVGKEGYIHGWICVRPPCDSDAKVTVRADGAVVHPQLGVVGSVHKEGGQWQWVSYPGDDEADAVGNSFSKADALRWLSLHHNLQLLSRAMLDGDAASREHALELRKPPSQFSPEPPQDWSVLARPRLDRAVADEQFAENNPDLHRQAEELRDALAEHIAHRDNGLAKVRNPADALHPDLQQRLKNDMASGETSETQPRLGWSADTGIVRFNNGSMWVRKEDSFIKRQDAEVLAHQVSDVLGAGAPGVVRTKPDQIWMEYVPGKLGLAVHKSGVLSPDIADSDRGQRIGLLDAVIGNQDRSDGNWIFAPDGQPTPIDHGLAQYDRLGEAGGEVGDDDYSPFWNALAEKTNSPWPEQQWDEWRQGLEALQPSFREHPDWYEGMLENFDAARASFPKKANS
jgi:hypothetical protein